MLAANGPIELVYGMEGRVLRCPWHKWEFDLDTGRVLFTGRRGRIHLYECWAEGGAVYVRIGGQAPGSPSD
jgi:3-phenylpropionate/trans-cinnamate dioxygenase ferredoxin subunit